MASLKERAVALRKKIGVTLWALKISFLINPAQFLLGLFAHVFLLGFLPVYIAVYTGRAVNLLADPGLLNRESGEILRPLVTLGVLLAVNTTISWISYLISAVCGIHKEIKIKEMFAGIHQNIPIRKFDDSKFCDRFSLAREGFDGVKNIGDTVCYLVSSISGLAASFAVMLGMSPFILLFALASLALGYITCMKREKAEHEHWKESAQERRSCDYLAGIFFSRQNAKEVRAFSMLPFLFSRWDAIRRKLRFESYAMNWKAMSSWAAFHQTVAVFSIVILGILIFMASRGWIAVGGIITIWALSRKMDTDIQFVNQAYASLYYNNEKLAEAKYFLNSFHTAGENDKLENKNAAQNGDIVFDLRDVSFAYTEGNDVLKKINLTIRKGETVAIVGENGGGKSTLVKVMLGLYRPSAGSVYFSGAVNNTPLKESVGAAFQDFMTWPFTLRENIGFGYLDELQNDEKIRAAAENGEALALADKLGIDRLLTKTMDPGGTDLSGGEWQRLALSRANMNDKPVLIFDEPAAKLDPIAELNQFARIKNMTQDRTAILISHRIGFARLAERILVMKDGRIIEDGTHAELAALNGEYKRMLDEQAQWYDLAWEAVT